MERLPGFWGFSEALRMQVLPAVLWDLVRFPAPGMLFSKYPELAQCTESHRALQGMIIFLLFPHIWLFYMQVHTYILLCVCHILKKTLLITCHQIIFSGRDIWKIYAESSSSGQQH